MSENAPISDMPEGVIVFLELQNPLPYASRQLFLVQLGHQNNDHRLLQHVDAIVPFAIDVPLFLTRSHFRY